MKNKLLFIICFFVVSFIFIGSVKADYEAVFEATEKCSLKSNATGNCFYADTNFNSLVTGTYWLDTGDKITVIESVEPVPAPKEGTGSECPSTFNYVSIVYNGKTYKGYACTANIKEITSSDDIQENFPESYWPYLNTLKTTYPNWKFVPINTELDFNTAVANEDNGAKSLIQYTSSVGALGYLSTSEGNYNWKTDYYTPYSGSTWFAANRATIAYYMDPRNFLNVNYIWMFEGLIFDEATQTENVVKAVLNGQYIQKYSAQFVSGGRTANVNPVYLASLSKQEVGGTTANIAISGKSITYEGKTYSGLYNFYNIGATTTNSSGQVDGLDAYRGIVYANGGASGTATSYSRPWKTEAKAILGGAQFISESYIKYAQFTSYFKKWNVVHDYASHNGYLVRSNYTNQYMQNIQAPRSEANSTYKSYNQLNMVNQSFTFYIPVYNNMPATTALPNKNSPNNYLKTLTININGSGATSVTGFDGAKTDYTYNLENEKKTVVFAGTTVRSDAKITLPTTNELAVGENIFNIVVTAANGNKRTYKVTINRAAPTGEYKTIEQILEDTKLNIDGDYITGLTLTTPVTSFNDLVTASEPKASVVVKRGSTVLTSGNVRTGDTVKIESGNDSITLTVVIYGDVNADGKISSADLARIQKHVLNYNKLTGAYLKAADGNHDEKVSSADLARIQKHILGKSLLTQK